MYTSEASAYFINYPDMTECDRGHVYIYQSVQWVSSLAILYVRKGVNVAHDTSIYACFQSPDNYNILLFWKNTYMNADRCTVYAYNCNFKQGSELSTGNLNVNKPSTWRQLLLIFFKKHHEAY